MAIYSEFSIKHSIFHSYVSLPEGRWDETFQLFKMVGNPKPWKKQKKPTQLDQSLRAYRESIHAKIVYQLNGCENSLQKMMKQWGLDSFPTKHTGCPIATYVSFQEATAFRLVGTFS